MDQYSTTRATLRFENRMPFGTSWGSWLNDKVTQLTDIIDDEADGQTYALIDKQYFRLMQLSCIYVKLDQRNRLQSLLQFSFYVGVLAYYCVILCYSANQMFDKNMVLFSQNTHFTLLVQLTAILIVWFQTKHRQITLLHKMLFRDFFDYQEPPTAGENALRSSMIRERRLLTVIPVASVLSASFVLVAPIIDKQTGRFDFEGLSNVFSTHMPYPYCKYFYQTREGINYYVTLGGQLVIGALLAFVIGGGGFLFLNLAQNVLLQLKLLQNSLDQIERRAKFMCFKIFGKTNHGNKTPYNDYHFAYCYGECLKKNFKHHQVILRAFNYSQEVASVPIFLSYMIGTIVIALSFISAGSVYELPGTTAASLVLCGMEVGYMYFYSFFGQRLKDLSMELRFKMYNIKWYMCNRNVKRSIIIFQAMTLNPLMLMAGGFFPADMETFSKVMRSAYSYYNVVNAIEK